MDAILELEQKYRKPAIPDVRSGDTVRVHQTIREGNKKRVQVFEGVVIRTHRPQQLSACITVRRIASGVGVEKTFLLHSPNVTKVDILRRSRVRRNFLSYLRERRGKSARLQELSFDKQAANAGNFVPEAAPTATAASDEEIDAEITELQTEDAAPLSEVAEVSTEDVAKQETKEAGSDDPAQDSSSADEQQLPAEEAESGASRADTA